MEENKTQNLVSIKFKNTETAILICNKDTIDGFNDLFKGPDVKVADVSHLKKEGKKVTYLHTGGIDIILIDEEDIDMNAFVDLIKNY